MKRNRLSASILLVTGLSLIVARGAEPQIAKLCFDPSFDRPDVLATAGQPAWILGVEQREGRYLESPPSWQIGEDAPEGEGRISITIDRKTMNEDLVATILFEAGEGADFAVQLFDAEGRVVVVDLFGNLVDVGAEAITDTFIVNLRKYPSAEKIVLRRIKGKVTVYGVVLYPVVTEGEPVNDALERLAARLGDPLSPDNPLRQSLQEVAEHAKVAMHPTAGASPKAPNPKAESRPVYPAATLPPFGGFAVDGPGDGLIAHWSFDVEPFGQDLASGRHLATTAGQVEPTEGVDGRAARFKSGTVSGMFVKQSPEFELTDTLTVSAWVKPAKRRPGQIVWFGDGQSGRDPWLLCIHGDGRIRFRSDRSVTSRPAFEVRREEIIVKPGGIPMLNQHVAADSPGVLPLNEWTFVTGRIQKISARQRAFTVFVNGEAVSEVRTSEKVDYPTNKMWVALGAVHQGQSQNFDGLIDEVRVYGRALSDKEIKELYQRPRRQAPSSVALVSKAP